jgi:hypothetical protein
MKTKSMILIAAALVLVTVAFSPVSAQGRAEMPMRPETMGPAQAGSGDWIRIGTDHDNDGQIDSFEYLHRRDLENARHRSMQRQKAATISTRDHMGYYQDPSVRRDAGQETAELNSVTGAVEDLTRINLAGMAGEHQLAKIRTADGRIARVDLGPVENLMDLGLRHGDRITVHGARGTINDKGILMAHRIEADGRTVSVGWPNDRHLSRYSGEVLGVRTASFRNTTVPEQVFARVLLDQGGVTTVNLGPRDMLRNMSPEELRGKQIAFLAHPARIGNTVALVADEVRIDGRTVHVDWTTVEVSPTGGSISRVQ